MKRDNGSLHSIADEYWRLVSSVRVSVLCGRERSSWTRVRFLQTAFNSRVRTHANWQHADAEVRRARQMHERAKAQGRLPTDRVGHTVSLVAEASGGVSSSQTDRLLTCQIVVFAGGETRVGRQARL